MASDNVPAFFIDWTKYPNMTRVKCCLVVFWDCYSSPPSNVPCLARPLPLNLTFNLHEVGMQRFEVSKKFRARVRLVWPQSEIISAEDDEDDDPVSDSDLVLLRQHMGNYIDSEEVDLNSKHPPASKPSNPSSQSIQSPTPSHARKHQPSCTPRSNFTTCHPTRAQTPGTHQPFQIHSNSPTGSLSSGSHQQRSRTHGQAVCQPTYPDSHSSACAPQACQILLSLFSFTLPPTFQPTDMDLGNDGDDVEALRWMTGMDHNLRMTIADMLNSSNIRR
ncbi:hypothetical protein GYMLUDRAFT_244761 [Collybiopsis luxurians FD-317 M1]|uniref:Uncharacterized protein n=1 Tax=Collybiopsis luxurians FD-317 M1 TaxID=944289 RepID=A0A0D0B8V7_9AGAR|nr:hypothetical protein GYMLUDRAFT_244761 [Collybiopsis luxurians FD-317 M1]